MTTNDPSVLKLKRWQVYELWRTAADAVRVLRGVLRGDHTESDAKGALRFLSAQLPAIYDDLPLDVRTAAYTLVPLIGVGPPSKDLLHAVWPVFETFGRLVRNVDGLQPGFTIDLPPLEAEKRLLAAAYDIDTGTLGATVNVRALAQASGLDLSTTRRVVCYWIDGAEAYLPHELSDPEEAECFVLDAGADARRDNWREYAEARIAMRRARIDISYDDALPHHWKETVEGAAMHLGLTCEVVRPTKIGVIVSVVLPEDWSRDDPRIQEFVDDVRTMLSRDRIQPAVHAPVSTYIANQVGAQGPNAVATGNTFAQNVASPTWDDTERMATIEELVVLRTDLLKTVGTNLEDGRAYGVVSQAESAARTGDREGMVAALRSFGPRLATLCDQLGLVRIKAVR